MAHGPPGPCAWPVLQFLSGLAATIFLDIVHISVFYQRAGFTDTERFGAGMAILSLLLKPLSCCFVYHMYRERGGELLLRIGEATPLASSLTAPLAGQGAGGAISHVSPVSGLPHPQPLPM